MTNGNVVIDVTDLRKSFGKREVLRGVTFKVYEGEIYGIVGPNGAGKTTTLRILSGIILTYSGKAEVYGLKPAEAREKGLISYMPEDSFPYERMTGLENLQFFARLYAKGDKKLEEEFVERGIKIAGLGDKIYDLASTYSRGMKRRLVIARALMVNPKIAILDEPTTALDVESSVRVRETIREAVKNGTTILLSSHYMLEVDYLCDRISLISGGKTVDEGTPSDIKAKYSAKNLEEAFLKAIGNA